MSMSQSWLECWASFSLDRLAEDSEKHVKSLAMKGLVQDMRLFPPRGDSQMNRLGMLVRTFELNP